jgi:hypothetical protein
MSETIEIYRNHVRKSFENAESGISKITQEIVNIQGMNGIKTRHFYNNLLQIPNARYLEIGVWKGSSVCSAMCGNQANVVCIDNWSEWGGPKDEFVGNFEKFKGQNNASFIEMDCFSVNVAELPKFNIYLYDGHHSEDAQYRALTHFYNCLDDIFIFIVDDWNVKEVRDGTFDAIKKLNLKIHYEKDIRLTWDNTHTPFEYAGKTWWNGIYVSILEKQRSSFVCKKCNTLQHES